ncbi:MAG: hypothetical protein C4291_04800 [Candidatus Dadabacteria bacterium]
MLDFIFPSVCPFCESVSKDRRVCNNCLSEIRFIKGGSICLRCGVPFDLTETSDQDARVESVPAHLCGECLLGRFYFDKARSVAFYYGLLRDMLHKFKYQGKLNLGEALSNILIENFPDDLDMPDIIIPVPLYIGRLRKREYNQSVVLGEGLSRYLRVSFNPFVLRRVRDTRPQFEIKNGDEKRKNVRGAFSLRDSREIKEKSVLIIDDIFTTGSTIDECARVLLDFGASRVQVVTLMRAVQI